MNNQNTNSKTNNLKSTSFGILLINNFILCLAFYLFVFGMGEIFTAIGAYIYNIPLAFKSFKIIFTIPNSSPLWTKDAIIMIYLLPNIWYLLSGVIFAFLYQTDKRRKGLAKAFWFWAILHSFNFLAGGIIAGKIASAGINFVIGWFFHSDIIYILFITIAVLGLNALAFFLGRAFLTTAISRKEIEMSKDIKNYKLKAMFLPAILVIIFLSLISFPEFDLYFWLLSGTMFYVLYISLIFRAYKQLPPAFMFIFALFPIKIEMSDDVKLVKERNARKISVSAIMFLFIVLILYAIGYFYISM